MFIRLFFIGWLFTVVSCGGNSGSGVENSLPAEVFMEKLSDLEDVQLVDVRTSEEFSGGHLQGAVNYDWNNRAFKTQIASLDPEKPVLVYCLSGIRSREAARFLETNGFKEVFELQGGLVKNPGPVASGMTATANRGMTMDEYLSAIDSEKTVLVDFYADWCAPCKRMEPYINRIAEEKKDKVEVIRIDADKNPDLCVQLNVNALPTIKIYRDSRLVWDQMGFVPEFTLLEKLQ